MKKNRHITITMARHLIVVLCVILHSDLLWSAEVLPIDVALERAFEHYENGRFSEALEGFGHVQEGSPTLPMPYFGMGLVYSALGQLDGAANAIEEALAIQPDFAIAHKTLGDILWRQRRFDRADTHYRKALALEPNMVSAYMGLGLNFASQRDFDPALEQFHRAIELDPALPAAYHSLGQTYAWMGQLTQAVEAFQKAIQLAPHSIDSHYEIGVVHIRLKDYPEAVGAFEKVVQQNPTHKSAYHNLGRAYTKIGQPQRAQAAIERFQQLHQVDEEIKPYRRRVEGDATDITAQYAMAQVYYRHGWMAEARQQCEIIFSIQPTFAPAYVARIQIDMSEKRWADALAWAQRLATIKPEVATGHTYVALIAAEMDDVDTTVAAYRRAIALEPASPSAYNNLAWFYAERNIHLDEAVELCQKAIEISPKPAYIDTLAEVYFKQGRYEAALQAMSKVLQLVPEHPKYTAHLERIQKAAKNSQ